MLTAKELTIGKQYEINALKSRRLQFRARKDQDDDIKTKAVKRENKQRQTERARNLLETNRQQMISQLKARAELKETLVQSQREMQLTHQSLRKELNQLQREKLVEKLLIEKRLD